MNPVQTQQTFYSVTSDGANTTIRFNEKPLCHAADLEEKMQFFNTLDRLSANESTKTLLFFGPAGKMNKQEYLVFFGNLLRQNAGDWAMDTALIMRFHNAINQFILKMATSHKILIGADSGPSALQYLCIGMVYDYRIIADDTVYFNPGPELGTIPVGGGVFFLSQKLGRQETLELLMSGRDVTAGQALEMGLVNEVVPAEHLEKEAIRVARSYAKKKRNYLSAIKKMLMPDRSFLKRRLDLELDIVKMSMHTLAGNCNTISREQ